MDPNTIKLDPGYIPGEHFNVTNPKAGSARLNKVLRELATQTQHFGETTITGSRGGATVAVLTALLTELDRLGIIVDGTSA